MAHLRTSSMYNFFVTLGQNCEIRSKPAKNTSDLPLISALGDQLIRRPVPRSTHGLPSPSANLRNPLPLPQAALPTQSLIPPRAVPLPRQSLIPPTAIPLPTQSLTSLPVELPLSTTPPPPAALPLPTQSLTSLPQAANGF